jgi:hypothetical protein
VQQAHGDRLDVEAHDRGGDLAGAARSERLEARRGGRFAPARADPALRRHERLGMGRAQAVQVLARLPPSSTTSVKPAVGDERGPRAATLEQRVGRHGHAVGERLDLARAATGGAQRGLDRLEDPGGLVGGRRRRLGRDDAAADDEHGVGERSPDVDAQQHRRER